MSKLRLTSVLAAFVVAAIGVGVWFVMREDPSKPGSAGETVSPPGVPYSYAVPSGWIRAVKTPTGESKLTSVGPPKGAPGYPGAIVSVQLMVAGTPEEEAFKTAKAKGSGEGWSYQDVSTAAGPALQVEYNSPSGAAGGRYVFLTGSPVFVQCQWLNSAEKTESLRGCTEVVTSLRITQAS